MSLNGLLCSEVKPGCYIPLCLICVGFIIAERQRQRDENPPPLDTRATLSIMRSVAFQNHAEALQLVTDCGVAVANDAMVGIGRSTGEFAAAGEPMPCGMWLSPPGLTVNMRGIEHTYGLPTMFVVGDGITYRDAKRNGYCPLGDGGYWSLPR